MKHAYKGNKFLLSKLDLLKIFESISLPSDDLISFFFYVDY